MSPSIPSVGSGVADPGVLARSRQFCRLRSGSVPHLVWLVRFLVRPFGYLAFVIALLALSGAARLLGEGHDLGFFSARLARMLWRYPEVTRRGVEMAWLVWLVLVGVAISPIDPIRSSWDEAALLAVALAVVWPRLFSRKRGGR